MIESQRVIEAISAASTPTKLEWLVALLTLAALCIAVWELRANAKIAGQTHAREAWLRYLELGIQYPQFGSTRIAKKNLNISAIEDLYLLETDETERYLWFVDILLESCESLVNYFPEYEWQKTISYNISLHREAIEYNWNTEKDFYSKKLREKVETILSS